MIHVRDSSDGDRHKQEAKNAKKQLREDKSHSIIDGHGRGHIAAGGRLRGTDFALHVNSYLSSVFDTHYITFRAKVNTVLHC